MNVIDLTMPVTLADKTSSIKTEEWKLSGLNGSSYTGIVHEFKYSSMSGTYIDFPGHIKETDDGMDAMNCPVDKFLRIESAVIHLSKESGSGAVSAEELKSACRFEKNIRALVINALGPKRFDEIESRSVFLDDSALDWIISLGIELLVSDIYESPALHGAFLRLFQKRISTVCCPVNLHLLDVPDVKLSCFFIPHESAVQLPCRLIAEF